MNGTTQVVQRRPSLVVSSFACAQTSADVHRADTVLRSSGARRDRACARVGAPAARGGLAGRALAGARLVACSPYLMSSSPFPGRYSVARLAQAGVHKSRPDFYKPSRLAPGGRLSAYFPGRGTHQIRRQREGPNAPAGMRNAGLGIFQSGQREERSNPAATWPQRRREK